jgi:hypothetical protein
MQHKGEVEFWGKIYGTTADYLVCGINKDAEERAFVYSVDGGITWAVFGGVDAEQAAYCDKMRGHFNGNPEFEYKYEEELPPEPEVEKPEQTKAEESTEEQEEEEEEEEEKAEEEEKEAEEEGGDDKEEGEEAPKRKPKKQKRIIRFPEAVRLAHIVGEVEQSCRMIPKDIHKGGLSADECVKLENYLHNAAGVPKEPLSKDMPQGIWALKRDPVLDVAVGTNQLYPGFTFYHKPSTLVYGQYYFGSGERNTDLCWML